MHRGGVGSWTWHTDTLSQIHKKGMGKWKYCVTSWVSLGGCNMFTCGSRFARNAVRGATVSTWCILTSAVTILHFGRKACPCRHFRYKRGMAWVTNDSIFSSHNFFSPQTVDFCVSGAFSLWVCDPYLISRRQRIYLCGIFSGVLCCWDFHFSFCGYVRAIWTARKVAGRSEPLLWDIGEEKWKK